MAEASHYFIIHGQREVGEYSIFEIINGRKELVNTIFKKKSGGLKESRQWIGRYLQTKYGFLNNQKTIHKCEKPGREESKNPFHDWPVEQYLNGVDLKR